MSTVGVIYNGVLNSVDKSNKLAPFLQATHTTCRSKQLARTTPTIKSLHTILDNLTVFLYNCCHVYQVKRHATKLMIECLLILVCYLATKILNMGGGVLQAK